MTGGGDLHGKIALVTGATSDLGRAIVLELVAAGARVHALGQRTDRLRELLAEPGAGPAGDSGGRSEGDSGAGSKLASGTATVGDTKVDSGAGFVGDTKVVSGTATLGDTKVDSGAGFVGDSGSWSVGGPVAVHAVDLRDTAAVSALLSGIGPIDILVLNAAHPPEAAPFLAGGMDKLRPIMEVNFFSPAQLILALLPGMVDRSWGRVIVISSLAAAIGEAHGPSYCASKAALEGLMRNLAIDYSPSGVTFNAIEAGPVMTERLQAWGATKARRFAMAAANRRVAQPEDVAYSVLCLASPRASHITGEELRVDGGLHLGNPFAAMYTRPGQAAQGTGTQDTGAQDSGAQDSGQGPVGPEPVGR